MAITINYAPLASRFHAIGNNFVIDFNESEQSVEYALIKIVAADIELRFVPDPNGRVKANLKDAIRTVLKNKNLEDIDNYDLTVLRSEIILSTYTGSNDPYSSVNIGTFHFVPAYFDYWEPNTLPGINATFGMHHSKIVVFGNLPIHAYICSSLSAYKIAVDQQIVVPFETRADNCGEYLKFLNKFGGYSYWLFNKAEVSMSVESHDEIFNDYLQHEHTVSPIMQMGKEARQLRTFRTEILEEWENEIVADIFTSPKVYLYIRERGTWLEVKVTNPNFVKSKVKRNRVSHVVTIQLPTSNVLTL